MQKLFRNRLIQLLRLNGEWSRFMWELRSETCLLLFKVYFFKLKQKKKQQYPKMFQNFFQNIFQSCMFQSRLAEMWSCFSSCGDRNKKVKIKIIKTTTMKIIIKNPKFENSCQHSIHVVSTTVVELWGFTSVMNLILMSHYSFPLLIITNLCNLAKVNIEQIWWEKRGRSQKENTVKRDCQT